MNPKSWRGLIHASEADLQNKQDALDRQYHERRRELEALWIRREQESWREAETTRTQMELSLKAQLQIRVDELSRLKAEQAALFEQRLQAFEASRKEQEITLQRTFEEKESKLRMQKIVDSVGAAVADIQDGATVMIGGFGTAGMPSELIDALIAQGARDLTIVNNNAGNGDIGLAALLKTKRVRKIICSFPRQTDSYVFDALYRAGEIELELVPQGNLAERIRAAGAGIGAFFTPTGLRHAARRRQGDARPSTAATTCSSIRSAPTSR